MPSGTQQRRSFRVAAYRGWSLWPARFVLLLFAFQILIFSNVLQAQRLADFFAGLPEGQYKSGESTLRGLKDISKSSRASIVKLDLDGSTVALGAVMDSSGLVFTKATEIKKGKLTAWLAGGKEVAATLVFKDEEHDVAMIRIESAGMPLIPVRWAAGDAMLGQMVVTPGIEDAPQAVGVVSMEARKIRYPRAFIGIQLDLRSKDALIERVMPGMPAEHAGVKPGDIVLSLNGKPVGNSTNLTSMLRDFREGQEVTLKVKREEEEIEMQMKLSMPTPFRAGGGRRGGGMDRQALMNRMGSGVSQRAEGFELAFQHDTVLEPWQCGGPLLNLDGQAIGLNIARAGRVASYALPSDLVLQIWNEARKKAAK